MDQQLRRLRLRVAAKLMLAVAFLAALYVVLSAVFSSNPDAQVVQSKIVDIGGMRAGDERIVLWEGRPILIYYRTDEQIEALAQADQRLLDEQSAKSTQPAWAKNALRSRNPSYFVSLGVGTDFSCPIKLLRASEQHFMNKPWVGGFTDECRGARYDFSGRVYRGQYADENLIIPQYRIKEDVLILGG